jgi:small subunit ribosomal protein S3
MGQKIRPTGFRTGIMVGWASQWYANKKDYSDLLVEDVKIRKFIQKFLTRRGSGNRDQRPGISKILIDRTREKVVVTLHSAKPGVIIGKKGENIDKLTKALEDLTHRHIEVKTVEVSRPETDPQLIAEEIAEQLEKRSSFRRTMKQAMQKSMEAGAKGIKLQLSGRLGGAEMARCEKAMDGSIPLSTLRTRVEYGFAEASTAQGNIGIKVWINNGDYLTEESSDAANAQTRQVSQKPARTRKR